MTTDPDHASLALPGLELPDYHGRTPTGMRTKLSGAAQRITRAHTIGDRVVLVVEARVRTAGHEATDDGLVYVESLKADDLYELTGDQGARLLSTCRSLYRTATDTANGVAPLGDLGEAGYTDASGVVLTPAELAELRGDPVRAVLSADLTPAVICYTDGTRRLWPDEYPRDTVRPHVADVDLEHGEVESVLHHETGEEIEPRLTPDRRHPSTGEIPDLPEADTPAPDGEPEPFSGDLGDDVDGWEEPDPATAKRLADAERDNVTELVLPTTEDFALVDQSVPKLKAALAAVTDVDHARRLLAAEKRGRGRDAEPRKAAVAWLEQLVDRLTS